MPTSEKGGSWLEKYLGYDLDTLFAYRTPRIVAIRDMRLGLSLLSLQLCIGSFVLIYQVILAQNYMSLSDVVGSVRLQMLAPTSEYRWSNGSAPYCAGVTQDQLFGPRAIDFSIDANAGTYAFTPGGKTDGAVWFQQRACEFLDESGALPLAETDRVFLSTEERVTYQSVNSSECGATLNSSKCVFSPPYNKNNPNVTRRAFVADVEYFTLLVDHNMNAPLAKLAYTVKQMAGFLLDRNSDPIDACAAYSMYPSCPSFIAIGQQGDPDIISIRTLLDAAGIPSLDTLSGSDDADVQTTSRREAGVVIVLDISYSNFYLGAQSSSLKLGSGTLDNSKVIYTYKVSTVPNTEYKFITATNPYGVETSRELWNRHGVRIIVTTSGRVGYVRSRARQLPLRRRRGRA
jgi:hypothetical protein